jgi:glycosyltransferase involved in cell wall biosynthesis
MQKNRVGIAHQSVIAGDAIGNDIVGMYGLLTRLGFAPIVVCQNADPTLGLAFHAVHDFRADSIDLLIYHHSQYWEEGELLLRQVNCPVLFRYHNITPARFFAPYAPRYAALCTEGRNMNRRLATYDRQHVWVADSNFNSDDLIADGIDNTRHFVVPPFNRAEQLLRISSGARYDAPEVNLLFVGRFVPNKGHIHLLRVLQPFVHKLGFNARLTIVGHIDPPLAAYYEDVVQAIGILGLDAHVEIKHRCSDAELTELFRSAHSFLCFSEHEGFCVPIVEAQAIGIPTLGAAMTAVAETAGRNQLFDQLPESSADYLFYAELLAKVVTDEPLREQLVVSAERNVCDRFISEPVENAFTGALYELVGA